MQHLTLTHALGRKVLVYILLVSSVLSLLATAVQLYSDYRYDLAQLEQEFIAIEASHLNALALNLWDFQDRAIEQQLVGIQSLPFINHVRLTTPQDSNYHFGERLNTQGKSQRFEIFYQDEKIGDLTVEANYQEIYDKLMQKAWVILLTQFVKTLIAALAIVAIVYWFITRHIYQIEQYVSAFNLNKLEDKLVLAGDRNDKDELDNVVDALNNMRLLVKTEFGLRIESEQKLNEFNRQLEGQVKKRTQELEQSLTQLKATQADLVQSEKMVALGQLVAGIAHEINTPLGISATANALMFDSAIDANNKAEQGVLTKAELARFFADQQETSAMLQRNLERAVNLIKSFKAVAVNQSSDRLQVCNIEQLVEEVLATVRTMFKAKKYRIKVSIPNKFSLTTYPSAWTQILTNLLMNSHIHGFEGQLSGAISIQLKQVEEKYILSYEDNGVGIPEHLLTKVFDPFVTTKRGRGGSGLGLNILFNLVFEQLNGTVRVENLEQGCRFTIECPIELKHKQ